jgi:hypothetical protein
MSFADLLKNQMIRQASDLNALAELPGLSEPDVQEQILKDVIDSSLIIPEPSEESLAEVPALVYSLFKENNKLRSQLERLQDYIDQDVDTFILDCCADISDFSTAKSAVELYNIAWFDHLLFSDEAKSKIANELIIVVSEYTTDVNPLWTRLVANNPNQESNNEKI